MKLPKDCDDNEIGLVEAYEPAIVSQPTTMTFFLARVQLADLCRELTDTVPLETSKLMQIPYEHIIALDKRLENFIADLPFFFRLDIESRQGAKILETIYPKIPIMRHCIMTAAHSRRCRLHHKFLLRQSSDPRYGYSRHACLDSARAVLQVFKDPECENDNSSIKIARMGMAMHYTHLALVVIVMDLCFNKLEGHEAERKKEVQAAFQMVEGARACSPLLSRSLSSLEEILQKYDININDSTSATVDAQYPILLQSGGSCIVDDVHMQPIQLGLDILDPSSAFDASFEEIWQTSNQNEQYIDRETWDNLFAALDSRPF